MRDVKVGERGVVMKIFKFEMLDLYFRRILGWIVEKRWEEIVRGVLRVEGCLGWWFRLGEGLLRR